MVRLLQIGEDFPGPVPDTGNNSGGVFEIDADGTMHLYAQMPNVDAAEMAALQEGFSGYSIYVDPDPPHVAVLIWRFPAPVGFMETPFHAGAYTDDRLTRFQEQSPEENNALTMIGLDRKKVILLRVSGLMYGFVAQLHEAITRQLEYPVTTAQYRAALERVYRFTSKEIYERGERFKHQLQQATNKGPTS